MSDTMLIDAAPEIKTTKYEAGRVFCRGSKGWPVG